MHRLIRVLPRRLPVNSPALLFADVRSLMTASLARFTANTGGTLVEKCCHFFDLQRRIVQSEPVRVYASGGQQVNHLAETVAHSPDVGAGVHSGTPDILDNAYVVLDFANGARAALDLCMFAEASKWQEEVYALGELGKIEAFGGAHGEKTMGEQNNLVIGLRSRANAAPTAEGGGAADVASAGAIPPEPSSVTSERCADVPQAVLDAGYHEGASFFELEAFVAAVGSGEATNGKGAAVLAEVVTAHDGLMAVAVGVAAHMSIHEGRAVLLADVLGD